MRKLLIVLMVQFWVFDVLSQEDREKVFRDTRIVNGHSTEVLPKGMMKFIISHRFGAVSSGVQQLWGLDNSTIRIGLDYAFTDNINVGFGRSSLQKHYDFYLKYRFLQQRKEGGSPVSLVYYTNAAIRTIQTPQTEDLSFTNNLSFVHQLLLARKFNEFISFQIMPTYVHRNFVLDLESNNDIYSIGTASRIQVTKVLAFNLEYYFNLPDQLASQYQSSAGLGIELETKGHIFQLNFTNSLGMIAPLYVAETTGRIEEGDIHFGFNITRDFKIGARK
ncbi:hypothetical protein MATR_25180 [Marivirga tractuosa]|uniref:DUF5777 domain-containing protein n=1 Tax=Marivirga tractuosa (strain ATCC 23168 / DSM 4126 / NBRC 15989 / NCIMB 1408 / VKM B-1430 / H-43) TaxID=643867 RepID=E4TPT9_MARTH|nr:DUF5777 family beta-barrel protein [Marivirga tractuosa]ADR23626.1 hypothetical protein Ftrac_3657 [Marivirga tractuosa DSM 4126]BDD15693.1 hypothetical protein MATR_25180 [Marivirga tractuosa]